MVKDGCVAICLLLWMLVCLSGCFPVIAANGVDNFSSPYMPKKFGEKSKKILVIEVWEKMPVVWSGRKSDMYQFFDDYFFTTKENLNTLHKNISYGASLGIWTPGAAIGKASGIKSLYLISDDSYILHTTYNGEEWSYPDWAFIGPEWKNDLINTLQKKQLEVEYFKKKPLSCNLWKGLVSSHPIKIKFSKKELMEIMDFIKNITPMDNNNPLETLAYVDCW